MLQMMTNRKREMIHYLHAALFLAVGISILIDPVSRPGTAGLAPALLYINYPIDYLLPLILYFYIRLLFEEHISLSKWNLLFLIPFVLVTLAFFPFFLQSPAEKLSLYPLDRQNWGYLSRFCLYVDYGIFFWMLICLLLALRKTRYYFSGPKPQVKKMFIFLSLSGLLALSLIISNFTENTVHYKINMLFMNALLIGLAALIMGEPDFYFKMRKSSSAIKYNRSQLKTLNVEGIMERINDLMELEQLFRDSEMTMDRLSALLRISRQQLSEIINSKFGQNFNTFLNTYRVEAAKRELLEDRESRILTIAMNCGFNSKTTFNKVFQDLTGMTPSGWRSGEPEGA